MLSYRSLFLSYILIAIHRPLRLLPASYNAMQPSLDPVWYWGSPAELQSYDTGCERAEDADLTSHRWRCAINR